MGVLKAAQLGLELPPRARRIPAEFPNRAQHAGTTSACAENTCCYFPRYY